jgi:hypothetical protein
VARGVVRPHDHQGTCWRAQQLQRRPAQACRDGIEP